MRLFLVTIIGMLILGLVSGCTNSATDETARPLRTPPGTVDQLVKEALLDGPYANILGSACLTETEPGLEADAPIIEHGLHHDDELPPQAVAALGGQADAARYRFLIAEPHSVYLFGRELDSTGEQTTDAYAAKLVLQGSPPKWQVIWRAHAFGC